MPGNHAWVEDGIAHGTYAFGGVASPGAEGTRSSSSYLRRKENDKNIFPPAAWGNTNSGFIPEDVPQTHSRSRTWDQRDPSYFETRFESDYTPEPQRMPRPDFHSPASYDRSSNLDDDSLNPFDPQQSSLPTNKLKRVQRPTHAKSSSTPHAWAASSKYSGVPPSHPLSRSSAYDDTDDPDFLSLGRGQSDRYSPPPFIAPKPELAKPLLPRDGVARAIALYDFTAVEVILGFFDRVYALSFPSVW